MQEEGEGLLQGTSGGALWEFPGTLCHCPQLSPGSDFTRSNSPTTFTVIECQAQTQRLCPSTSSLTHTPPILSPDFEPSLSLTSSLCVMEIEKMALNLVNLCLNPLRSCATLKSWKDDMAGRALALAQN